jgi:hypothetical protein
MVTKVASRKAGPPLRASAGNDATVQDRNESDVNADSEDIRILSTHLQSEAEQSYMAVRPLTHPHPTGTQQQQPSSTLHTLCSSVVYCALYLPLLVYVTRCASLLYIIASSLPQHRTVCIAVRGISTHQVMLQLKPMGGCCAAHHGLPRLSSHITV